MKAARTAKLLALAVLCQPLWAAAQGAPAAPASAPAAAAAPAATPSSPAKKELVQKITALQRQGVERMALQMVEQPALQMMQAAAPAVQRLPADKREAMARDIQADARKYVEDTYPAVRDRAVALMGTTLAPLLEERLTEEELREVLRILESPANRKFLALAPEMQQAMQKALVEQSRSSVESKVRALEQSIARRVNPPATPGTGAGSGTPPSSGVPARAPAASAPAKK